MFTLCICLFLYISNCSYAYENVALNKPAYQQYPYMGLSEALTEASNAVDGLRSNLSIWGAQCVQSDTNKQTATWWVNLNSILSIHHITIYYRTENVEWECVSGFYGDNCSRTCGKCSDGEPCHHVNGTCLQGCKAGYQPPFCTEECQNSKYGTNCSEQCGKCRDSYQCHHVNGSCLEGCDPGYQGEKCITECDFGYYGFRCLHECSTFCKSSRDCHHVTGSCINGCKNGWQGNDCLEVSKSEDCPTDGNANFYGMLGAFCLTLVLIGLLIAYIIVNRRKKTESAIKYQHNEQAKPMENRYHETYENEAINSGYQELGEFNKESTTYSTLGHVDTGSVLS